MPLNDTGLAVGDIRDGYRVSKVINAAAGRYAWQAVTSGGSTTANVVDKTPTTIPVSLAALQTAVPASGQSSTERWESLYGTAGSYRTAKVVGSAWVDADTGGAVTGAVINVTPATQPATLAALETAVPAAGKPAAYVWEASYGSAGDTKTARVIGGAWVAVDASPTDPSVVDVTPATIPASLAALATALPPGTQPATETWQSWYGTVGAYQVAQIIGGAWTPVAAPVSTGHKVNVTPATIPATVTALEAAKPAAGQPSSETWQSIVGAPGSFQLAEVVSGAWTLVSRPANVQDVTPATMPSSLAALQAAVPAAGETAPIQWVALYGVAPDLRWASVVSGVWTETTRMSSVMVGATESLIGQVGTVPAPAAGTHDLPLHGDASFKTVAPDWVTGRAYSVGALVVNSGQLYRAKLAHTSSPAFATDAASWLAIGSASPPRLHITNTATAPASAGAPTVAEATTAIGANRNAVVYYTGDDNPASTPSYVWHVDSAGAVTLLRAPGAGPMTGATSTLAGAAGAAPQPAAGTQGLSLGGDAPVQSLAPDWVAATAY